MISWHNNWLTSYKARVLAPSAMLIRQMINYQYISNAFFRSRNTFFCFILIASIFNKQGNAQANQLVELKTIVSNIKYDLRYATKNNFTGEKIYPSKIDQTYLVEEAANALKKVAEELASQEYGILVWDAYRPYDATVKFWNLIHDERYVANPSKGSGHNRGIAIDMSIYKLSDQKLIEMPTGFDNFSDTAHHDFMHVSEEKIKNRNLLKSVMEKHGFLSFQTEWWHYSWPNVRNYEILNLSFHQLKKKHGAKK